MAVVEDFYIGNTHVCIHDDYCKDKSPEDVQKILDRIAKLTLKPLQQALAKQESFEQEVWSCSLNCVIAERG